MERRLSARRFRRSREPRQAHSIWIEAPKPAANQNAKPRQPSVQNRSPPA